MKSTLIIVIALQLFSFGLSAQSYEPPVPVYNDKVLINLIETNYYKVDKKLNKFLPQNASHQAFRDTIMPIFSQFAVGNNAYAKNANVLAAEVATKETRISYNAAAYFERLYGIYNLEVFATGKDNLASVFSKAKFKGTFGINLSSSFLLNSTMYYDSDEAKKLHNNRLTYAWLLEERVNLLNNAGQKASVTVEINRLNSLLSSGSIAGFTSKDAIYASIIKLQDSLAKFLPTGVVPKPGNPSQKVSPKEAWYIDALAAFDKKFAKWHGFNLWTLDLKVGFSSEGFNYYSMEPSPVNYPVITENGKRFTRKSIGLAGNFIHSGKVFSSKTSIGGSISNFIGFDGQSADDITEQTQYDSLNVSRSIEKKYSAYNLTDAVTLDTYQGAVLSFSHQMLLGKDKLFGFGFTSTRSNFFNGQYNGKVGIDNTYSLLIAFSKKGDILNKNVLAINFKTPDLLKELPKSLDKKTGNLLRTKDKLEIGITFALTIDKLLGK